MAIGCIFRMVTRIFIIINKIVVVIAAAAAIIIVAIVHNILRVVFGVGIRC